MVFNHAMAEFKQLNVGQLENVGLIFNLAGTCKCCRNMLYQSHNALFCLKVMKRQE